MNSSYIILNPSSLELYEKAKRLASFPTSILIEGEIGSGKKVMGETIHSFSNRATMPFIKINCGSLQDNEFDVDYSGIERLSLSSSRKTMNLFESADQGTLFLDEVGELSPKLQAKLLRFIQDRDNEKVGGSWSKKLNIRIISSSTVPLVELVKEKKFREDLYYRLNVAQLHIEPLRNRPDEITPLLEHYLTYFCREFSLQKQFEKETLEALNGYRFPGNIQELKNIVEVLCVTTNSRAIYPTDLPSYISAKPMGYASLESQVGEFESQLIIQALQIEGSIRKAAARLKISHATLLRKMQKWGIEKESV